MNSKLRVREALDVLYMQGEDAGKSNYGSATHQIAAVAEAEKAIRQAVGEEMLSLLPKDISGADSRYWPSKADMYNDAIDGMRQKIKQWQGGEDE